MSLSFRKKKELFYKELPILLNRYFEKYFFIILITLGIVLLGTLTISIIMSFTKASNFFPPLVLSAASLIAILAYLREHNKVDHEKKRLNSEFFFKQASQGLDEALGLLKNQNNDRVLWIRAARALIQANKLFDKIELEEFRLAYQLFAD